MQDSAELRTRLKQIIVSRLKLDIPPESIVDDAPLFGDSNAGLGLDSIDALELVLGLEEAFGIKVDNEEVGVKAFASIDSLATFVEGKLAAA